MLLTYWLHVSNGRGLRINWLFHSLAPIIKREVFRTGVLQPFFREP